MVGHQGPALQRFAIKNIGRVARVTTGIPVDKGYAELENIFDKLERIQKIFADPNICSIRLVVNPEKMVLNESKRAFTYLCLYGYNVDAVIVNRVFENDDSGPFSRYFKSQQKYLKDIDEIFSELPIKKVLHQGVEVFGMDALRSISDEIYQDSDPVEVLHHGEQFTFQKEKDGFELKIKLPFLKDEEYSVSKFGDEIVIQLGNRRKNIFLPRFVNFYSLAHYQYNHPWLIVSLKE